MNSPMKSMIGFVVSFALASACGEITNGAGAAACCCALRTGVAVNGVAIGLTDPDGEVVFGTAAEARAGDFGVGVEAAARALAGPRLPAWMDPARSEDTAPPEGVRDPGEPPSAAATGMDAIAAPTPRATANAPT